MTLELNDVSDDLAAAITAGLKAGADQLLDKSNALVPFDDGDLKKSGRAVAEGTSAAVGYSADHAIKQHEKLNYHHDGGQAKYLETAFRANASEIQQTIADHIRDAL